MPKIIDIREEKKRLRQEMKAARRDLTPSEKQKLDAYISEGIWRLPEYEKTKMVVTYVSTPIEVDTWEVIGQAWQDHKQVVVPRCVEGERQMNFYRIRSPKDLERGSFGLWEPFPVAERQVTQFEGSICLVPALCYDDDGYRLGYGGGYYDRFLKRYPGLKIGIIYSFCQRPRLLRGKYDLPVDLLINEKETIYLSRKEQPKVLIKG